MGEQKLFDQFPINIYLGMRIKYLKKKLWYVYISINIAYWSFSITFNVVRVNFHFNIDLY